MFPVSSSAREVPLPLSCVSQERRGVLTGSTAAEPGTAADPTRFAVRQSLVVAELRRQNAELEKTNALIDGLTAASAETDGLEGLVLEISRAVGARVALAPDVGAPFSVPSAWAGRADAGMHESAFPVLVRSEPIGWLRVAARGKLGPADRRVLEHGARLVALELQRESVAPRTTERLKAELLEELLADGEPVDGRLIRRLARLGLDLSESHLVVVVRARSGTPINATRLAALACLELSDLRGLRDRLFCIERRGCAICFLPQSLQKHSSDVAEALRRAACSARERASAGLSGPHASAAAAVREAEACVALACEAPDPGATVEADRLGALRFVLALPDLKAARSVVEGQLGQLLNHDRRRGACLTATLKAFLELDGNQAAIAARCHVHISTVKYRMKRIAEILRRDVRAPHARFELTLAFKAADLFAALGQDLLANGD
jgi:sugar diacid utilization regulator